MPPAKAKTQSSKLVLGFLEGISSKVFSEFSQEITQLVGKKQGVYAPRGPRPLWQRLVVLEVPHVPG